MAVEEETQRRQTIPIPEDDEKNKSELSAVRNIRISPKK